MNANKEKNIYYIIMIYSRRKEICRALLTTGLHYILVVGESSNDGREDTLSREKLLIIQSKNIINNDKR